MLENVTFILTETEYKFLRFKSWGTIVHMFYPLALWHDLLSYSLALRDFQLNFWFQAEEVNAIFMTTDRLLNSSDNSADMIKQAHLLAQVITN